MVQVQKTLDPILYQFNIFVKQFLKPFAVQISTLILIIEKLLI